MIKLPDRSADSGTSGYYQGMNSLDDPLTLKQGECQLLENCTPIDPLDPREALVDIFTEGTARGYGSEHTNYTPEAVYMIGPDGKEYLFNWTQNVTTATVYNLEVVNITDHTRTILMSALFASATAHFSMLKIYSSIYCLFDTAITTNYTFPYLKRNMIIYWTGSAWGLRAWGIDCVPSLNPYMTADADVSNLTLNIYGHSSVVFNNKMWVIGGATSSATRKVYSSSDGITWTESGTDALPVATCMHTSLVFNNKMWVIGGYTGGNAIRKVYSSSDGITWTESGTDALPVATYYHTSLVFNNKMWVIGGLLTGGIATRKVYSSSDGTTWTESGTDALPVATYHSASVIFNNKMWVIGGYTTTAVRKVYSSSDGITWTESGTDALPVATYNSASVVFNNKMWVIGGYTTAPTRKVYSSSDGITWTESGTDALPVDTYNSASMIFNNKMWVIFGTGSHLIYSSLDGIIWTKLSNGITSGYYFSITGTFVRRRTSLGVDTSVFEETIDSSMEQVDQRQSLTMVCSTSVGIPLISMPMNYVNAIAQGATHFRVWRTLGDASETVADGLSLRYLRDFALTGVFDPNLIYHDLTTDAELTYETNTLDTTGFQVSPAGRFACWDQERLWLSTGGGYWLYSVGASSDAAFPQKFASLFQAVTQKIVFEPNDSQRDTGIFIFQGDLYFCKEQKIGILDNHDPANIPRTISHELGIDFPNTIAFADHPKLKQVVFGLSHKCPIVLRPGASVEVLETMRLSELWYDGYTHVDPGTGLPRSLEWKETVFSLWHKDSWRIAVPGQTIPTIFGFYASPDGKYIGSYRDTLAPGLAGAYQNDPIVLIPKDGNVCYGLSNKSNVYRVFNFLKSGVFQDNYGGTAYPYHLKVKSRRLGLDAEFGTMGECTEYLLFCDLVDAAGLSIVLFTDGDRFECPGAYTEVVDTAIAPAGYNWFRKMLQIVTPEGCYGRGFDILIDKVLPADGNFKYRGVEFHIEPMQDFGAEFYSGTSPRENGWE
jgi:hypothetical protein